MLQVFAALHGINQALGSVVIYIVEDDAAVRDALSLMCESFDQSCQAFPDVDTFIRRAAPTSKDTLFVDLHLPDADGADLINIILTLDEAPQIVAITGQPLWKIRRDLPKIDETPIVRKPLTEQDLLAYLPV